MLQMNLNGWGNDIYQRPWILHWTALQPEYCNYCGNVANKTAGCKACDSLAKIYSGCAIKGELARLLLILGLYASYVVFSVLMLAELLLKEWLMSYQ